VTKKKCEISHEHVKPVELQMKFNAEIGIHFDKPYYTSTVMSRGTRSVNVLQPWQEETGFSRLRKMTKNVRDIPEVVLASFVLFLLGFLFHFIGFVAPGWYNYSVNGNDSVYGGLWNNCTELDGCYAVISKDVEGKLNKDIKVVPYISGKI
jgi:hypothetical protein